MKKIALGFAALSIVVLLIGIYLIIPPARNTVPFEDMVYNITQEEIDVLSATLNEHIAIVETATSFSDIEKSIKRVDIVYDVYLTMSRTLHIRSLQDVNNDDVIAIYEENTERSPAIHSLYAEHKGAILNGEYREEYKELLGEFAFNDTVERQRLYSDEVIPLELERVRLEREYKERITSGDEEAFAEIYLELIRLDNEIASKLGFENAVEMYYLSHGRDYSPQDSMGYMENVKKYYVPLLPYLYSRLEWSPTEVNVPHIELHSNDALRAFENILPSFGDDMVTFYYYMAQNNLLDIDADPNKQLSVPFANYFPTYDAPFLYMNWDGTFSSIPLLINEFGHAFDIYSAFTKNDSLNTDVAEIYSQSLEVLFLDHYAAFVGEENAQRAREFAIIDSFVFSNIYSVMMEEFQITAYTTPNMTSEDLVKLFNDLKAEYNVKSGSSYLTDAWHQNSLLFNSPFYGISHGTSQIVALELLAISQNDWNVALQKYKALIHTDRNMEFLEILKLNDIPNPFEVSSFERVANTLIKEFDIET